MSSDQTNKGKITVFGEMLLRLSAPDSELLLQSGRLDARFGGAEINVAVFLAGLGHHAQALTVLPENDIGKAARGELRRHGVDDRLVATRPGRMGLYFLTPGRVRRPSDVLYDRKDSAFAQAAPDVLDFEAALAGCDWLHLSGITPAVSPNAAEATLRAVRLARALKVPVSFDVNYREKLWADWTHDAPAILRQIVIETDVLFAEERDIALLLGKTFEDADPLARRRQASAAAFAAFPNLRRMCSLIRTHDSVTEQQIAAVLATAEAFHIAPALALHGIVDRIGTGDAFVAGVLHGLIGKRGDVAALNTGLAAAAHKHSVPGDFGLATEKDIAPPPAEHGFAVRR